jgi:predicted DNA-binding transcriptional regulator
MHTSWPSNLVNNKMKSLSKVNQLTGFAVLFISIFLFLIYAYFLLSSQWGLIIVQVTVLIAVAALVSVIAWIGYTMATASRV